LAWVGDGHLSFTTIKVKNFGLGNIFFSRGLPIFAALAGKFMTRYIYGIDFGTSNSALAILDTTTNSLVRVLSIPSILFFPETGSGHFVGQSAVDAYVASGMKGRFMKSVKRILPNDRFRDTKIGLRRYTAEDLVSLVIAALKREADAIVGEDVQIAVVGRPVFFDEDPTRDALAQARLEKAAALAGFTHCHYQYEPIGAAYTFERDLPGETLVMVADFGGGTSDFSLMRLNPARANLSDRKADVLAKGGLYVGGDSFDSAIMWERGTPHFGRGLTFQSQPGKWLPLPVAFFQNICSWEKMNFFDSVKIRNDIEDYYHLSGKRHELLHLKALVEHNLGYKIFQQIEAAKIKLSSSKVANFAVKLDGIRFTETITLESFGNEIIPNELDRIHNYWNSFLERQAIQASEIDLVFMTGGTSMVKPLRDRLAATFGNAKLRSGDDFNSVVMGLAHSYHTF
jgi:hypothetical chaperone protein